MIRYAVAVFLTWAVVTYAWAAFSHVSGFVGPAEASRSSLDFVANAMELVDPPGALGVPQRFATAQIRQVARSAERLHGSAERVMGELVDRLGHADAHDQSDRRRRHRHRKGRGYAESIVIQLDKHGQAQEHAQFRARIELERHREAAERAQEGARREFSRARREMERTLRRNRRHMDVELRLDDRDIHVRELQVIDSNQMLRLEALAADLEAAFEGVEADLEASLDKDELKRRLEEKIREILENLEKDNR